MSSTTHDAETTLRDLRKRRGSPACYPCFKKKVKCRGGRPCEACTDRGHPEICHVEEMSRGSRRHPKGKAQQLSTIQTRSIPAESTGGEPHVGEFSAAKFLRNNLRYREGKEDTFHVMGMRNSGFPISLVTLNNTVHEDVDQAPLSAEILQYYPAFRDLVMPLYPIVPDPLSLERWIDDLLHNPRIPLEPGKVAVVLSCLALGAQFTEAQIAGRWDISQKLISRASTYLQRANCIFEPSREIVQSLLMIGIGLQNLGLSHGAWNLLGLTYRCAQSIGLHHCHGDDKLSAMGAMLWTAVTWQDALMSLRYDRAPLTEDEQEDHPSMHAVRTTYPYYAMINRISWASRNMLRQTTRWRHDPTNISSQVSYVEQTVANAPEHLNPHLATRTLQQRFQYYSLRVHSSLLMAEFCRPSFSTTDTESEGVHRAIRRKGMHYLVVVVESFLELCTFSNVPLRLWSLRQAAVTCALVLALLVSKQPCTKAEQLLRRLVDVFRTDDASNSSSEVQSNNTNLEIYGMHRKCATLLECVLNRKTYHVNSDSQRQCSVVATAAAVQNDAVAAGVEENSFALVFDDFLNWPSELSLFDNTFSDSLLQANNDGNAYGT